MFRACLFPSLLLVSSIFYNVKWVHGYHEDYQSSVEDAKNENEIVAKRSQKIQDKPAQMIKENTDSLHRIRRFAFKRVKEDSEDSSSSVEEITYNPNLTNPFDDPKHFVHKYHYKRNIHDEMADVTWLNSTRERIEEEIRSESYVKSDYRFRAALEEKLFELRKKGQLVEMERIIAQIERAQKTQEEFLKSLEAAGKKAKRRLVTPLPDNPVPDHHQHMDHLRDIKAYMIKRRMQNVSEPYLVARVSDKMMKYWFNYIGRQTVANNQTTAVTSTSRPSTPRLSTPKPMAYYTKATPAPGRNPFNFFKG